MRKSLLATAFLSLAAAGGALAATSFDSATNTLTYNDKTYTLSSGATCANGTQALYTYSHYWCPTSTTASTGTSTGSTGGSTGSTSGSTTTTSPTLYKAQLSWAVPTTRADGKPLSLNELKGYEVYYTNDSGTVSKVVSVSGGSTTGTAISSLGSGNYSFSVAAVDSAGLKSKLSPVVAVKFP